MSSRSLVADMMLGFPRFVPVFKPVIQSLGPAFALYTAMMPSGTWTLIVVFAIIAAVIFLKLNPRLSQDLTDAWNGTEFMPMPMPMPMPRVPCSRLNSWTAMDGVECVAIDFG